jgi:uncharacterized membrane protein HdeD (DUF308 family)
MLEGFLLGIIVACTLAAATFFLKFWRKTRDPLFFAFGFAFLIEAVNRCFVLFTDRPNEGSPWIYAIRLASYVLILGAIIHKNRKRPRGVT